MSLSDELDKELSALRRSQIERVIDALEGKDLEDFIDALNNENVPTVALSRALMNRNLQLDARRISDYRNNRGAIRYGRDGQRVT
jgi:hypothetical protein